MLNLPEVKPDASFLPDFWKCQNHKAFPMEIEITPAMARALLETNRSNRRIRHRLVEKFARDMEAGKWKAEARDPIRVARTKRGWKLIDGQHRLLALWLTGKTIMFVIIFNLAEDVQFYLDQGASRSGGDAIEMQGLNGSEFNSRELAAIIKSVVQMPVSRAERLSNGELVELRKRLDPVLKFVSEIFGGRRLRGITVAPVFAACVRAVLGGASKAKVKKFFELLITGEHHAAIERGIFVLRDSLVRILFEKSAGTPRDVRAYLMTARAIEAYVRDDVLTSNRVHLRTPDPYPLSMEIVAGMSDLRVSHHTTNAVKETCNAA